MNIKKCHDIKVIRNIAMFRIIMRHCFAIYIYQLYSSVLHIESYPIKIFFQTKSLAQDYL